MDSSYNASRSDERSLGHHPLVSRQEVATKPILVAQNILNKEMKKVTDRIVQYREHDVDKFSRNKDSVDPDYAGFEGGASTRLGFLTPAPVSVKLPKVFEDYENLAASMPELLRFGNFRAKAQELKLQDFSQVVDVDLPRAALVLSSLAHAFYFQHRLEDGKTKDGVCLPRSISEPWDLVCRRLGRPEGAARVAADDILNNYRLTDASRTSAGPLEHALGYFGLAEEALSNGLQARVELEFAPCLSLMNGVFEAIRDISAGGGSDLDNQRHHNKMTQNMVLVAEKIASCGDIVDHMAAPRFDPIIWGRTYPEMGRDITGSELGNSGVDAPMFHVLDAFLGRASDGGDLQRQQENRFKTFPPVVRQFIAAVSHESAGLRDFIEARGDDNNKAALAQLMNVYAWFLERHRRKAIGAISLMLAAGRPETAGGASGASARKMHVDEIVSRQMKTAMWARRGSLPDDVTASVVGAQMLTASGSIKKLTLQFKPAVSVRPGARLYLKIPSRGPGDQACVRAYSVGKVAHSSYLETNVDLTIRLNENSPSKSFGPGTAFLNGLTAATGTDSATASQIKASILPSPLFQLPRQTHAGLIFVGQGSGVGPLRGFVHELMGSRTRNDYTKVLFFVCAKDEKSVPYLDELKDIARGPNNIDLTLISALSAENASKFEKGVQTNYRNAMHFSDAFRSESGTLRQMIHAGAHTYVCGGVDFGMHVREQFQNTLAMPKNRAEPTKEYLGKNSRARQIGVSDRIHHLSYVRYHEDLFGTSEQSIGERIISRSELARHNKFDNLWVSLRDGVYDLTSYQTQHPGGPKTFMEVAGSIGDRRFNLIHAGAFEQEIMARMAPFRLGSLQTPESEDSRDSLELMDQVVLAQNKLQNNTDFTGRSNLPFYVVSDALVNFVNGDLRGLVGAIFGSETSAASQRLDALLEDAISLRTWGHARVAGGLAQDERLVWKGYLDVTKQALAGLDVLKETLGDSAIRGSGRSLAAQQTAKSNLLDAMRSVEQKLGQLLAANRA